MSAYTWAYWGMVRRIARILHHVLIWAESCSCHFGFLHEGGAEDSKVEISSLILRSAGACPMRGLRCPDLSLGEPLPLLNKLFSSHGALLLLGPGESVTAA